MTAPLAIRSIHSYSTNPSNPCMRGTGGRWNDHGSLSKTNRHQRTVAVKSAVAAIAMIAKRTSNERRFAACISILYR